MKIPLVGQKKHLPPADQKNGFTLIRLNEMEVTISNTNSQKKAHQNL